MRFGQSILEYCHEREACLPDQFLALDTMPDIMMRRGGNLPVCLRSQIAKYMSWPSSEAGLIAPRFREARNRFVLSYVLVAAKT